MRKAPAVAITLGLSLGIALAAIPNNTLVQHVSSDTPTIDPGIGYDSASGAVIENVYETLLQYKGKSVTEFEPGLATAWTSSNGGRTHTFTLRKNVKFHSGNMMSCADAEYSFERLLVTNHASSPAWFMAEPLLGTQSNANDDKSVTWAKIDKAIECNAAGQLVFTLAKTDPSFLSKLLFFGNVVIDRKHAIEIGEWDGTEKTWKDWVGKDITDSALNKKPSGTGAYMLVSRSSTQMVFKAFADYWDGKPKIENVIVQLVPELATRLESMKRGDVDFLTPVGAGNRASLSQIQNAPGVRITDNIPQNSAAGILMNQNIKDPAVLGSGKLDGKGIPANFFSDLNVRKAFSYAFNYDSYLKDVLLGKGARRTMLLPENYLGYDPKVKMYNYNLELAKAAFQKAWGGELWKNGFVLQANYRANSVESQLGLELLKQAVEKLNPKFKINLQPKVWSELLTDSRQGKTAMIRLSWLPDYADPDNFLYTFYASDGFYSPRLNFKDGVMDNLLREARTATDTTKRRVFYSQVGNRAYELAPVIILPSGIDFLVSRDNVKGTENYNIMRSNYVLWKELSK